MELVNLKSTPLSYIKCNMSSLICLLIIIPFMTITIFISKIFVISDMNKILRKCSPISYYFGETVGCKKLIYDNAVIENFESSTKNDASFLNLLESSSRIILTFIERMKIIIYQCLVKTITYFAECKKSAHII